MSSGAGEAIGPAPFGRDLHPSMPMASSSSTTVINRTSPSLDHRLQEADSNDKRDPEPEASGGVVPRPDCVSDSVRDLAPALCPGHGLNPGVAPDHVSALVPVPDPVSDLARERLTHRAPHQTPRPGQTCGHASGLELSGAVHATEDQSRGNSNLTRSDRVRSNDGEQPMQCDPSPEHARDA
ncbi:hypothetical protein HPB51_014880 [Rhipicephalus microplus]|uniref:Uncharacterized protein n=1 Tax=Rhipicephalus microplus TaxID=6941 RepID=A0A9J6DGN6_RHIMP|nr:hypothetical protein HPB51_014880 [Rhipicephalus microplus]